MNWQANFSQGRELLARLLADPVDASLRIAILAAHPDDEIIGASALLARFPATRIVYLTGGAPRDTRLWPPDMHCSRKEYAVVRRQEAIRSLAHAGISEEQIFWLGGVDQGATFEAHSLASKLADYIRNIRPDLLITHPYEGGHPDHDCAALVAHLASAALRSEAPQIAEMTSYHARDGSCVTGEFLGSPAICEIEFPLSDEDRKRKCAMMNEYKSQRLVLENFPIVTERLRLASAYDFSHPPHEGKLWYECMGWRMTGTRWRELAAQAVARFTECSCP